MANEEQLAILKQGVMVWNEWRENHANVIPDLISADLRSADLISADLISADLRSADLFGANLARANLARANLARADLFGANLARADLFGADLRGADLRRADLRSTDLRSADLSSPDLSRADLSSADLRRADLFGADLSGANLARANLARADLFGANLSGADLSSADLSGADLFGADLSSAELSEAVLMYTKLIDVDLSTVKGLGTVRHHGPSTIGVDTIYKSKGSIPHKFLLDTGMPKEAIDYLLLLAGKAIEFYSCFISYSTKDEEFAQRLHADLQAKGVRCWFAPEDLKIGDEFRQRIDEAIRLYDKLLLVLSEHSVNSTWVQDEVEAALEKEIKRREGQQSQQTVLFPVRLDTVVQETEQAWAAKIRRQRHIGDFTHWKDHDAYQKAFDRLLRDLKAEAS